jgi:hypothetical protein
MMQSCASRRSSGAAGPFFRTAWKTMGVRRGTATSDRHRQSLAQGCQMVVLLSVSFRAVAHDAGRRTTSRGISSVVTRCQRATSTLRASATIIVLRVLPRPSAVRAEPLGQGAVLLETPSQLEGPGRHYPPRSRAKGVEPPVRPRSQVPSV